MAEIIMDGIIALNKSKQLINGVATGVSRCSYDSTTQKLIFTCNDGTTLTIPLPYPLSADEIAMIHLMTIEENSEGDYILKLNGKEISGGDSGATITRTDGTTSAIGGIPAGTNVSGKTAIELWEEALFPYQKPVVSFSITPSQTIYEKNIDTITSIVFNITATKKSNNITALQIFNGATLINTITVDIASGSATKSYTYACNITADTTLKVVAVDGKNNGLATKDIKFVDAMYCGYVNGGITKVLQAKGNYTFSGITCTNDKIVFKYPASYGNLTSIIDSNGFENLAAFSITSETINGISYNVYTSKNAVTLSNFSYTFKF